MIIKIINCSTINSWYENKIGLSINILNDYYIDNNRRLWITNKNIINSLDKEFYYISELGIHTKDFINIRQEKLKRILKNNIEKL